jgi:hypothetical protein
MWKSAEKIKPKKRQHAPRNSTVSHICSSRTEWEGNGKENNLPSLPAVRQLLYRTLAESKAKPWETLEFALDESCDF